MNLKITISDVNENVVSLSLRKGNISVTETD